MGKNAQDRKAAKQAKKVEIKLSTGDGIADALEPSNVSGRVGALGRRMFSRKISPVKESKLRAKGPADRGPKSSRRPLALRAVIGNATVTKTATIVWFRVPKRSNSFSPVETIELSIRSDARAYSELLGYRCFIRSSNRPHPVASWAEHTWQDAAEKASPLPGFRDYLLRQQNHMAEQSFNEKWVYLGVRVAGYRRHPLNADAELAGLKEKIDAVTIALGGSSLRAEPASARSMEWLLRRSIGLGLPCPAVGVAADYGPEDIEALETHAEWTAEPFTGHIEVEGQVYGQPDVARRMVSVLTLGRLSDTAIPQEFASGWMQRTDQLDFDVEWSATFDLLDDDAAMAWLRRRLDAINNQEDHYNEHQLDVPPSLDRQRMLAREAQGELDSDHGGLATRTVGYYRLAVSAEDTETLKRRVQDVRDLYGTKAELVLMPNQYECAREFIPGEPLSTTAHQRRMSALSLAASIPQGSSNVGDRYGMPLGRTAGSATTAAAWATHRDMEGEGRSGLCTVVGEQGAGKSFILGSCIYYETLSGAEVFVFDPSARLGALTRMDDLKDYAKEINLFNGRDGELNPYRVVPTPLRELYDSEADYEFDASVARGTRKALMTDVLNQSLDPAYQKDRDVASVMGRAIDAVPSEPTSSGMHVIRVLEEIAKGQKGPATGGYEGEVLTEDRKAAAADCARNLLAAASTPIGRLLFPATAEQAEEYVEKDIRLTVYTLNGLNIPEENERGDNSAGTMEKQALMAVRLAAFLVQSKIYQGDVNSRKCLVMDEGKIITSFPEGKKLITKSSTDSRKHNLRFLLASQDMAHFDFGDSANSLDNLVGSAIVGHTMSKPAQEAALKVMKAPANQGYEEMLGILRAPADRRANAEQYDDYSGGGYSAPLAKRAEEPRQVVFYDGQSIERIVIDMGAHPQLVTALDTNATGISDETRRARRITARSENAA